MFVTADTSHEPMGGEHRPTGDAERQLSTASLRVADVYLGGGGGRGGNGGGGDGGGGNGGGGDGGGGDGDGDGGGGEGGGHGGGRGGDGGGGGGGGGDGGGGGGGGCDGGGGGGGGNSAVHTDPPDPVNALFELSSARFKNHEAEQRV